MSLKDLVGNVYYNWVTGNQWKIVSVRGKRITLQNERGMKFKTTPEMMINYSYVGKKFTKKYKEVLE